MRTVHNPKILTCLMARYSSHRKITTEKAMTAYKMEESETDRRYCRSAQSHSQSN